MKHYSAQQIQDAYGAAVRHFRLQAEMTQMKLAAMAELHLSYVSDVERGRRNVGIVNAIRVAQVLNVPVNEFFAEVEKRLRKSTSK